jgi:hypothetical protein
MQKRHCFHSRQQASIFCTLRKHHPEKPADTGFKLFCRVYFPLILAAKACREMDYLAILLALF